MGCGNENRSEDCSKCCSEGGSPLLQQGELDFSPAKQPPSSKWAFSPGLPGLRRGARRIKKAGPLQGVALSLFDPSCEFV
jgi:hypothetical protein